jgi:hypothetical protein
MRRLRSIATYKTMLKRLSIPQMTQAMADPFPFPFLLCNLADLSAVYVLNPGASGRLAALRRGPHLCPAWEPGGGGDREASKKVTTGLQHAYNLLATLGALKRSSGVGSALHLAPFKPLTFRLAGVVDAMMITRQW